jgi:hypothetical protein
LCAFSHPATSPAPQAHGGGSGLLQAGTGEPAIAGKRRLPKTICMSCQGMIAFLYRPMEVSLFHFEPLGPMTTSGREVHSLGLRR